MRRLLPVVLVAASAVVSADEGMWMPQQVPELSRRLREMGFDAEPASWADLTGAPLGAVISLGGCTASFISPDGLVATNHHCVQGSLQYNSTPERNLLRDGFLARTRAEELWNGPASRAYVTVRVREVTGDVLGSLPARLADRERYALVERRTQQLIARCEAPGLRCRVDGFLGDSRFFETAQLEIRDVRLVWAPPPGIGNFGGETDNWQWPRHTGDFSFYRAYVGPDGQPADHAPGNVPYRPRHWLSVSAAGASPGQAVVVAGYPGRTYRTETLGELRERVQWTMPRTVRRYREIGELLQALGGQPELAIKAEARLRGVMNALKKTEGVLAGASEVLAAREREEAAIDAWVAADPARESEMGPALDELRERVEARAERRERDAVLTALPSASVLLDAATVLHRLSLERPKKDVDRDPEYQERNWPRLRERLERMQRTLHPELDRTLLRHALREAAALPEGQRIAGIDRTLGLRADDPAAAERIEAWIDGLVTGSRLSDPELRLELLTATPARLRALGDPALGLVLALQPETGELREREKADKGAWLRLRPLYVRALQAVRPGPMAPDANGTLRVTVGTVHGVPGRDGILWAPQTTLGGIEEKHTGRGEFAAPPALRAAIARVRKGADTPYRDAHLGDVPVDFLSDVDTTGGNSGSPTLDARGELVGLLFDGTLETVGSDHVYDRERTRSIHVDSRYLLFVLREVEGAAHLLSELGVP